MAHSLESKVPFLDFRFVEFNLSLPPDMKIADGYTKRILREAMNGILPEKIRMLKDKIGFATAEEYWMEGQNSDLFRGLLMEAVETSREIFTEDAFQKLNQVTQREKSISPFAWRVICFGRWMKIFNVSM